MDYTCWMRIWVESIWGEALRPRPLCVPMDFLSPRVPREVVVRPPGADLATAPCAQGGAGPGRTSPIQRYPEQIVEGKSTVM